MKTGRTLTELAMEIERQKQAKKDYKLPTSLMQMNTNGGVSTLQVGDKGEYQVTEHTHNQLGSYLDIPSKFYDRMRAQHPDLIDHTVNRLLERKNETRMLRTLDGNARAFLSRTYRMFDNYDLAQSVLPVVMEHQLEVVSCDLTPQRLYIKALSHKMQGEVRKGDIVEAGLMISNSEIGQGNVIINPFLNRLVCSNGAVINELSMKRRHVGRESTADDELVVYSDQTRMLEDQAFWSKIVDTIKAVMTQEVFDLVLDKVRGTTSNRITGKPDEVVEIFAKENALNQDQQGNILSFLIQGGDLTQYGLFNSVTASAQADDLSYDEATRMEALGGQIIELSPSDWRHLNN